MHGSFRWRKLGFGLLLLALVVSSASAQELPKLQVKASVSGPAIAGQELLYTFTLLNKGDAPLGTVFLRVVVPEGTTYLESGELPGTTGWASGGLAWGEQGKVYWFPMEEPLPPNQPQSLYLKVQVSPMGVDEIVLGDYAVSQTLDGPAIAGETLRTKVIQPTPTPTPTFTPTPTSVATPTSALTLTPSAVPTRRASVLPSPTADRSQSRVPSAALSRFIIVGLVILFIAGIAIWLWHCRSGKSR